VTTASLYLSKILLRHIQIDGAPPRSRIGAINERRWGSRGSRGTRGKLGGGVGGREGDIQESNPGDREPPMLVSSIPSYIQSAIVRNIHWKGEHHYVQTCSLAKRSSWILHIHGLGITRKFSISFQLSIP